MTSARIKAIRTLLGENPVEFSFRMRINRFELALWEAGKRKPNNDQLLKLARVENLVVFRGSSIETINEKEKEYAG
jgi:DNA-binding transcriptional regulator YiaG